MQLSLATLVILLPGLMACRTTPAWPPADLTEPGWKMQQGQAVWRARRDAPEIAGELEVAFHPDGRSWTQFSKPPISIVVARMSPTGWQIQFAQQNRAATGRHPPPSRIVWLQLVTFLAGKPLPADWSGERSGGDRWRLENRATGEFLEGFLTP